LTLKSEKGCHEKGKCGGVLKKVTSGALPAFYSRFFREEVQAAGLFYARHKYGRTSGTPVIWFRMPGGFMTLSAHSYTVKFNLFKEIDPQIFPFSLPRT
jgi:hypothetical protein